MIGPIAGRLRVQGAAARQDRRSKERLVPRLRQVMVPAQSGVKSVAE